MKNSNGMKNPTDTVDPNENTTPRPKLETFDDVLPYVGDFGRYQWLLLLALLPYSVAYATLYFSQFFLTLVPQEHWCKIEELIPLNLTREERVKIGVPKSQNYPYYDQCHRRDLDFSVILSHGKDIRSVELKANKSVDCSHWEYNFTQIPYASIAAELDWVCDQEYLISTAQSIFFCGSIVGGLLFGWIADHRGRIPALILCNGIGFLASAATASANTFLSFAVCRFFTGLAFDNCINIPLIIVLEYMAVNRRTLVVNVAFGIYFAVGSTVLPWIAYYVANWKFFAYVSAIPMVSAFITPWILPESARNQAVRDRAAIPYLMRFYYSVAAKLTMSVLSRFCLNMAANVGLQYAAELLPTPIRTQGVALIHIFGIVAHSVAPYVVDSAKVWDGLPMMIISVVSFAAATLVLFLPETLGRDLPQTLRQGEDFGKEQSFWTMPCCGRPCPNRHRHYRPREL
ncbi:solute carrier family 22 member 3-like [Temnothorax curvispinosus]|uniref:Solute carrier family 22 member 3-like n=1 Tax=Temnothorax curvispinosus TaxID=300111 RepID=A0A6J1PNV0_9HYME|nr:solute carrier family 22 member 3-like [Temnothorax curvispinosus]